MKNKLLMGKKRGMTHLFSKDGKVVPCTVIEAEPNVVVQIKTEKKDGYSAVQIGFEQIKGKTDRTRELRVSKPLRGHFSKAGVSPRKHISELSCDAVSEGIEVGKEFKVDLFSEGSFVDVQSISKGKGFQGVIKLHGFSGGPAAHGSGFHRHAGSTGMRSTPGRCFPGGKRASRMGGRLVTIQSLEIMKIDADKNLILVKGAVSGSVGALVTVSPAIKKENK